MKGSKLKVLKVLKVVGLLEVDNNNPRTRKSSGDYYLLVVY